jgi:alkylation response protein AidB-like acyl-CoA dehydrogenase
MDGLTVDSSTVDSSTLDAVTMDGLEAREVETPPGVDAADSDRDADLLEFRSALRRLLDRRTPSPPAGPGPSAAGDYDVQLWELLTGQVGVAGLAVPEHLGGSGFGYPECHLVLEELGRAAVASPFLASAVLATQALLLAADDEAAAELLPDLAAGTRTATLVWGTAAAPLTATADDGSWLISGRARHVLDGARADLLLAFAEVPEPAAETDAGTDAGTNPGTDSGTGTELFLLDVSHPGLRRDLSATMDQSLHLAEVHCRAVPARRLSGPDGRGGEMAARLADLAAIAITADQVGGARRCLELTVEYTKNRVQFGRPIGSFQAVKHRLADLLVLVESAHSASEAAARAWAAADDDAPALASLAKSYCSEAYRAVAAETIQLHGGIGFTWEHPAHRYFKRAHSTAVLFGDPAQHRHKLAERLGLVDPDPHPGGSNLL